MRNALRTVGSWCDLAYIILVILGIPLLFGRFFWVGVGSLCVGYLFREVFKWSRRID
jgi:hypothetical protein